MKELINRRRMAALAALAVAVAVGAPRAASDEFTLKDGRKISGTIVGYDANMFRVQTDFGYVLIRKDKVVSIRVEPGNEKKTEVTSGAGKLPAEPEHQTTTPASSGVERVPPPSPPLPKPPPPSQPLSEPLPAHLRERVVGNDYINDTFQFSMYKPPDWKLLENSDREKVSAIVAMSSQDEQTVFFVDRQVWSGTPNLHDDRMEAKLRKTYQDFKEVSESSVRVDGLPAIRKSFTGVMDAVEWHGVSVRITRGNTVFGIVGLTSAETFGFQEALFNKMIRSFHFLTSPASGGG
jgi:hypothetical protein